MSVCRGREAVTQTELYDELLAEVELADKLGLSAYWMGEHHFSTGGTVRNTLLMLAAASQRPHPPIWQAVTDTPSLEAAAEEGDNLLLSGLQNDPEELMDAVKIFRRAADAAGHSDVRVGFTNNLFLGSNEAEVEDRGMEYL